MKEHRGWYHIGNRPVISDQEKAEAIPLVSLAPFSAGQMNEYPTLYKIFGNGSGDWSEDFEHENGDYNCQCIDCGQTFTGHKRRNICKVCADETITVNKKEYTRLLVIEKKYIKLDRWYWSRENL